MFYKMAILISIEIYRENAISLIIVLSSWKYRLDLLWNLFIPLIFNSIEKKKIKTNEY